MFSVICSENRSYKRKFISFTWFHFSWDIMYNRNKNIPIHLYTEKAYANVKAIGMHKRNPS